MKPILLLLFAATAACVGALLPLISRARSKRLLLNAVRRASSDAPDGIGISVLCSGVTDAAQIENLLSPEYSRYEVIVVLDARRHAAEFAALTARYRMIRVEWVCSGELEVSGVRALGRSRRRCFRRLVLVDRVFDGAAGDLDAAAAVATYDYLLPVRAGCFLLPGSVERLVAECRTTECHALVACITADNDPSRRLFESIGFRRVSHFEQVGRKFGRWLDVVDYELLL